MIVVAHTRHVGETYARENGLDRLVGPVHVVVTTGGPEQLAGLEPQRVFYVPGPTALRPRPELAKALERIDQ